MDGTRDRPPGKTAENWGRRDGIRAGAVSGPWRSAPRERGRAARRPGGARGRRRPRPRPRAARRPSRGAAARRRRRPNRRRPAAVASRVGGAFGGPARDRLVGFGLVVAAGAVVAAVPLRRRREAPGRRAAAVRRRAPAEPTAAPAAAGAMPALRRSPASASSGCGSGRTFRPSGRRRSWRRSTAAGIADGAGRAAALRDRDLARRLLPRRRTSPAAEALGGLIAPVIAAGGEVGVRDYGQLLDDAEPGRLDLWVGG